MKEDSFSGRGITIHSEVCGGVFRRVRGFARLVLCPSACLQCLQNPTFVEMMMVMGESMNCQRGEINEDKSLFFPNDDGQQKHQQIEREGEGEKERKKWAENDKKPMFSKNNSTEN